MKNTILVRGARQLLTLRGPAEPRRGAALRDPGLIQDGSVLIQDGIILEVGSTRRLENLSVARNAEEIDATRRIVMPGFVDSHTHLVCGPPRLLDYGMRLAGANYQEIAEEGGGILSTVKAVRAMTAQSLERQARAVVDQFVRHGTTTVEAKTGYGLDQTGEWKTLRVIAKLAGKPLDLVPTYLGAHVVPPEFEGRADDYIDWMRGVMLPRIRRKKLARFVDVYCDKGAFHIDEARRYLAAAKALGFELKVHAEQLTHAGATRLAVELGAASADHLDHVNSEDIAALAQSDTIATLLPGAVFHLGLNRYAPARELIDHGAAVALATDFNPGTSPTCNMPMILSLACTRMRMTPAEAITAATINGAHAVGAAAKVGSIEPGKFADLILLDASDYREIPYHFGVNLVAMTMKKGVVIYTRGEVVCPGS